MMRFMLQAAWRRRLLLLMTATCVPACTGTWRSSENQEEAITLALTEDSPRTITVKGLDEGAIRAFWEMDEPHRQAAFPVRVANAPEGSPALLGEYQQRGSSLVFLPRYGFEPGLKYAARFVPANRQLVFMVPAVRHVPSVRVAAIYPSADELPENLLKFYIHFSGPMSRGEAYRRVHLLNDAGQEVAHPFLELGEELWNPETTRFTLFFDPGRIKQGLVPRMELGPALERGRSYTLVIDAAWTDGNNVPLAEGTRKIFRVGPTDSIQPLPSRWHIEPPTAGTKGELVVVFDEPLDHAMLERMLSLHDVSGRQITGKITISEHETRWIFTPENTWQAGKYTLQVESILEDRVGNSIFRPFEVDLNRAGMPEVGQIVEMLFEIKANK